MKKKVAGNEPISKKDLDKALSNYPTKKDLDKALSNYPTKWDMDKKFDEQDRKWDQRFIGLKNDIFTRFDELMGELSQMREDRVFEEHDVKVLKERTDDHEKRIIKLETVESTS